MKVNNKFKKSVPESSPYDDRSIDIFFDEGNQNEELNELEELNEELEVITEQIELSIMEEFFDFVAFEEEQKILEQDSSHINSELSYRAKIEYTVADIIFQAKNKYIK
ncbi:hypothetical protein F8M41_020110 [Gigaspora margarita]|uniref:Uncharacterized protein n=1 Tax=Gigaspora margarita TaxID=4874 RepID=A0A8H4AIW8_GIGMA|nr:hypothetical protein F8M41_020110 [Gigaspora margarita]